MCVPGCDVSKQRKNAKNGDRHSRNYNDVFKKLNSIERVYDLHGIKYSPNSKSCNMSLSTGSHEASIFLYITDFKVFWRITNGQGKHGCFLEKCLKKVEHKHKAETCTSILMSQWHIAGDGVVRNLRPKLEENRPFNK